MSEGNSNGVTLNVDRVWYDRGYKLGSKEERRDSLVKTVLWSWLFVGLMYVEPVFAVTGLLMHTIFNIHSWREIEETCTDLCERYDAGDKYEWGDADE